MREKFSYRKKIIGTLLVLLLAGAGFFTVTSNALAQFIAGGPALVFDGVVTGVTGSQVTLQTDSTSPIVLNLGSHSVVTGGTLAPGEEVKAVALRSNGVLTAQVIRVQSVTSSGYGSSGSVVVNGATFVSNTAGVLTVNRNGTLIHFAVNSSTHFVGDSTLTTGQNVLVVGSDNGTTFQARVVVGLH